MDPGWASFMVGEPADMQHETQNSTWEGASMIGNMEDIRRDEMTHRTQSGKSRVWDIL